MATITRKQAEERLALPKLNLEQAVAMLDKEYELVYTDYCDVIEDKKIIEQIISTGFPDEMDDAWISDQQWESANQIIAEKFKDYDVEDIEDELRQEIWDRDVSNPWREIIGQTRAGACYYKLGIETGGYGLEEEDLKEVLSMLKIDERHESFKAIRLCVAQASYGGMVTLMFNPDLEDFYGDPSKDKKFITFDDPYLAIMDRFQGSGDFCQIKGSFCVPFDRERIHNDAAAPGYGLLSEVFGCSSDAVDCTYGLSDEPKGTKLKPVGEALSYKEKKEIEYERKWKEEKVCSFGDMRYGRHPDNKMEYINNFPCGTKCHACGTFWID